MFQTFAAYLLRNRVNAILMAILFSLLPYFSWVSCVIVALVTWRKGEAEGFIVLLWAALPAVVVGVALHLWLQLGVAFYGLGVVFLSAAFFRRLPAWSALIQAMALLAVVVILLVHLVVPDITAWWQQASSAYMDRMQALFGQYLNKDDLAPASAFVGMANLLARMMTGLSLMWVNVSACVALFIARSLSRSLPAQPEFIKRERTGLRMTRGFALLFVAVLLWASFGPRWPLDLLPVLGLPFILDGLALINGFLLSRPKLRRVILLVYIVLWILVTIWLPLLLIFGVLGLVDTAVDLRSKFRHKRSASCK